jgi:hypothetical protein
LVNITGAFGLNMKLFLDCEFTNFQGHLISMALVSEDGDEFYEVVNFSLVDCHEWVLDNVVPILVKESIPYEEFQKKLSKFLRQYDSIEVIADWPEDFWHFTQALLTGPGMMMDTPKISMEIVRRLDSPSVLPHNALEDAKGIKAAYLKKYTV